MSEIPGVQKTFELLSDARFEIGGEDQLADRRSKHLEKPADADSQRGLETDWTRLIADMHIRTGTLLKTDTLSPKARQTLSLKVRAGQASLRYLRIYVTCV